MVENNYHVLEEDKEVYSDIWDKEKRALINYEVVDLLNEQEERIKKLEQEKESWKSFACHDTNLKSMLSFEIEKLTETKDINAFLDFYYEYFCKINGDVNDGR